jgi:CRISPR/Cas system CMR subunit Cmr4 (Cas7 group RAMP superfamily)
MAHRPGQVRDAILDFFEKRGRKSTATTAEIRAHVERVIGPVPPSSVRSYLQIGGFERVGRGEYRRKAG